MKKITVVSVLVLLVCSTTTFAQPKSLPSFSLKDPRGGIHTSTSLLSNGVVIVITAPTLHDKGAQEGWDNHLVKTMPKTGAKLVFLEDMSASAFKGIARKDMHKDWQPGVPPLLLLDETGSVRKSLGVGRDQTAVLVYDKKGQLVYADRGSPSAASAEKIWAKLSD